MTDPLSEMADALRRHPNFDLALNHYVTALLSWTNGPRVLTKLSSTHTRSQILGYLMLLHFNAAKPDEGPTYQKILSLCERRRDCSPTVLKTVLALLRLARLVTIAPATTDRRLKIYHPTPKLVTLMQDWYGSTFGCFDIMTNTTAFSSRVGTDVEFLRHVIISIGNPYINDNIQLVKNFPDIYELFMMDSGFNVAAVIVAAHLNGAPVMPVALMAKTYNASPSQVRNVLKFMRDKKLIQLDQSGKLSDSERLVQRFSLHVARELALYAKYALGLEAYFDLAEPSDGAAERAAPRAGAGMSVGGHI